MITLGTLGTGQEVALGPSAKAATHHTHVLWKQKTEHLNMPLSLNVCLGLGEWESSVEEIKDFFYYFPAYFLK